MHYIVISIYIRLFLFCAAALLFVECVSAPRRAFSQSINTGYTTSSSGVIAAMLGENDSLFSSRNQSSTFIGTRVANDPRTSANAHVSDGFADISAVDGRIAGTGINNLAMRPEVRCTTDPPKKFCGQTPIADSLCRPTSYDSQLSLCNGACDYDCDYGCDSSCGEQSFYDRCYGRFCGALYNFRQDVRSDYRNYYSWRTGRDLLLCIGGAAIMANTTIDEKFQHWVQTDVRSSGSDDFASFWKAFGEGHIFIPAWAGMGLVGSMLDRWPLMNTTGEFGMRTTRAYLVGVPPMIFMQYCLGGSRPEEGHGSAWKPFDDSNGVSGHAFIGGVPFITAAQMSDNCCIKSCFYFMSVLPAWSRINDDSHYLSQAWMGWWMAYLACRSVSETETGNKCMAMAPILAPDTIGMMFEYRR